MSEGLHLYFNNFLPFNDTNYFAMKIQHLLVGALVFMLSTPMMGQDKSERKSPPATASGTIGAANISINYSQPSMKGREVFGGLVPYEKIWRTGANEATTIETDKEIGVNGGVLPAGKYALFTIPGEKEWTIIFNSETEQWGSYNYDDSKDALRVKAKAGANEATEKMTFTIDEEKSMIFLDWAETRVVMMIKG